MKLTLLVVVLMLAAPASESQKRAPTVEICRYDAALWYSVEAETEYLKAEALYATDGVRNRTATAILPLPEVQARLLEMTDCVFVDSVKADTYKHAQDLYYRVQADRWGSFLRRHHLYDQLLAEDAQGIR